MDTTAEAVTSLGRALTEATARLAMVTDHPDYRDEWRP